MLATDTRDAWKQFLLFAQKRCSKAAFGNWFSPIEISEESNDEELVLLVPNIFVQEYVISNYKQDLKAFLPVKKSGEPAIRFVVEAPKSEPVRRAPPVEPFAGPVKAENKYATEIKLNPRYRFDTFIEGPSNQFVKSASMGVASKPGQSYNPLFIHGGVGLGKTHLLHSVGHHCKEYHKHLRVQCITTEQFINDLVDNLRNKSVDRLKRFYRYDVDVLLVDDIQFLQNRQNFEEEFCNTFEALINQKKQIIITSDKPPGQLKLSERMIARMEWGLVAQMGVPDLETRVAIILHKAELKGIKLPQDIAFHIGEHIYNNVRQLEGLINRLSAQCRLLNQSPTEELVEQILAETFQLVPQQKISVEQILKSVCGVFQVRLGDLKSNSRTKEIALPRQVAMYLAKELINESLMMLGAYFGKTHSTILHAHKTIGKKAEKDEQLRRQINMVRRSITA